MSADGRRRRRAERRTDERRRRAPGETLRRFVQGDLASLRVVLGLAVIWVDLPVPERPLPLRREPDQPDAADHRGRA